MLDAIGRANQITVTIDHQGTRLLNQNLASTDIDGTAAFTRLQLGAGEYRITFDANSDATPSLRAAVWDSHAGQSSG